MNKKFDIIYAPIITEKTAMMANENKYAFKVDPRANKTEIKLAIEELFKVKVEFEEEMEYTIVGSAEADPMNGRISNESPVGMALLGHKEGDSVSIDTPDGEAIFKVLKIAK